MLAFSTFMIVALVACLGWLLAGGAHRSAHPDAPRRSVLRMVISDNLGRTLEDLPACLLWAGRSIERDGWEVGFHWDLNPGPMPGEMYYRRRIRLIVERVMRPEYRIRVRH